MVKDISQWTVRPKSEPKKPTKREIREKAESEYRYWLAMLQAHEVLWNSKWESAKNPFISWQEYKQDRPARAKILGPYLKAKEAYLSTRERS